MAESADALDSGSSGSNTVCVQVTLSAPNAKTPYFSGNERYGIFLFVLPLFSACVVLILVVTSYLLMNYLVEFFGCHSIIFSFGHRKTAFLGAVSQVFLNLY